MDKIEKRLPAKERWGTLAYSYLKTLSRRALLGYLSGANKRTDWGDLDGARIVAAAEKLLAGSVGVAA